MAQFEGTIKEFTKFIGPHARLKVAFMSAKYKKEKGKCEDCGVSNSLDAAHIKGKGRALLIANILSEFIEDDIIKIDLNEFEERFVQAHLPIESTIRILCKDCHRKYDKIIKEESSITNETSVADESMIIEELVQGQMNKSKAMKIAYSKNLTSLTNSNTIFSNIILALDSWWLQPFNDKFKSDLYIILNDNRTNKLYIFKMSANTITNPSSHFKQRNDKFRSNCSDIYIPLSSSKFVDKNGFDFTSFLTDRIEY
jgi:hypothetical protein